VLSPRLSQLWLLYSSGFSRYALFTVHAMFESKAKRLDILGKVALVAFLAVDFWLLDRMDTVMANASSAGWFINYFLLYPLSIVYLPFYVAIEYGYYLPLLLITSQVLFFVFLWRAQDRISNSKE